MVKGVRYVITENFTNMYRIFCISKYEILAEMKDSKLGIIWNFVSPTIQVITFYLVFGLVMKHQNVQGIPYLPWVTVGLSVWWFIQPSIVKGCVAIFSKTDIIKRMKFPFSILPMTVIMKELFHHCCMLCICFVVLLLFGIYPTVYWLGTLYYMLCAIALLEAIALITSVLTMLWRDVKKLISALMRMLLYLSMVLFVEGFDSIQIFGIEVMNVFVKYNPVTYIVRGYRDCLLMEKSIFAHPNMMLYFWVLVGVMFCIGSFLMYKFKKKFIDMI
ncbi:MAG: ABC transporter permease [Longicatena sp.]